MSLEDLGSAFRNDSRGVSEIIGALLVFSMLVILLSVYQAQFVPQENKEIEFQHFEAVQDDMVAIRSSISTSGQTNVSQFPTITTGTRYPVRLVAVNPSDPAGRLQSSQPYPLYVNSSNHSETIDTRFLEYSNGYNELSVGSIWYEHSVLYLDERDRGNGIVVLEDQNLVRENSSLRVNALQNEFGESSTGRVTVELYPVEQTDANITKMSGTLTVKIPTRLNETEYWDDELGSVDGYNGVEENAVQTGVHLLNLTVDASSLQINTVGINSAPEDNGTARYGIGTGSGGGGGGGGGSGGGGGGGGGDGLDNSASVVYGGLNLVEGDGGNTSSLAPMNVKALGPAKADLTGNGTNDLPYVDSAGNLKIVDNDGNIQTLESKSPPPKPRKQKTLMAVTEWQGSDTSVFYANKNKDTIYRVTEGGPSVLVAVPPNGVQAVMGKGDIDGDGTAELIFAGSSQQIRYLEPDGSTAKVDGGGVGANNGIGVGTPPDFDGDGTVRVVTVDGSQKVKIVGDAEPDKTFSSTNAKKAPVTAADVDNDDNLEIIYVGSGGKVKYIDDPLGSPTIRFLKDSNGNQIDGDGKLGVVS